MSEGALFAAEFDPAHTQHRWRLWGADLVDLALAGLVGWGAARALDVEQSVRLLLSMLGATWAVLCLVGGVRGWTLGRRLLDVRLVAPDGRAPGAVRALARAFTVPVDMFLTPLLPSRPLDRLLGVHGERMTGPRGSRLRGVALQLPWVAALVAAAWFIATPTRHEALSFLDTKLTGWKCCHGYKQHKDTWMCRRSLSRLSREAQRQHPQALALMPECPEAPRR
ncbi:MAG TPA: RDD family protein [Myxococcaceae bacterium]|nr:RDD family protein [Myxococcaceae bacterium]